MPVTQRDIERGLESLGFGTDSHVLVHSSYRSFGGVDGGPSAVVRALAETLGTVMMPSFTSDRTGVWDSRGAFDGNAYPSRRPSDWPEAQPYTFDTPANKTMGIINETFRTSYDVQRTAHPLVSFVAYGALADDLVGPGTELDAVAPIRRLMEPGGDVLLMGVTHTSSTSIHLAEQMAGRELFIRYALTPAGVKEVRSGGCGNGFDHLQPHVQSIERREMVGKAALRCYELQAYVESARQLIDHDPFALLCGTCERCQAHKSRVPV